MARRRWLVIFWFAAVTLCSDLAGAQEPEFASDEYRRKFSDSQSKLETLGATTCDGCHNGDVDRAYSLWRGPNDTGAHFRAYKTLYEERSVRMAQILAGYDGQSADPRQRADCLACHSFGHDIPSRLRDSGSFDIQEGVTCEACHGRAELWRGPHQEKTNPWHFRPAAEWLEKGMYEMRDPQRWVEKCLECHMTSHNRGVTHTLIAAGHPALTFEVVYDSQLVPEHWEDKKTFPPQGEGSWFFVRLWSVGQATALREAMRGLVQWAESTDASPDFAVFDCYACHHEYQVTPSREPRVPTPRLATAGQLGQPGWNAATWITSRHVVNALMPEHRLDLDRHINTLARSLSLTSPDRAKVRSAGLAIARLADELANKAARTSFDRDLTNKLLRDVLADVEVLVASGPFGVEQASRALFALYSRALVESAGNSITNEEDAQIRKSIQALDDLLYGAGSELTLETFEPDAVRTVMKELAGHFAE